MTTTEMLNAIANNNYKMPKTSDWADKGLVIACKDTKDRIDNASANGNFCKHLEKVWIHLLKFWAFEDNKFMEVADFHATAAFSCINLVLTDIDFEILKEQLAVKVKTNDKQGLHLAYASKPTFRKNCMKYMQACKEFELIDGYHSVTMDERVSKAIGCDCITRLSPEVEIGQSLNKKISSLKNLSAEQKQKIIAELQASLAV